MKIKNILFLSFFSLFVIFSGCKSNLLSGESLNVPAQQPQTPPAPVVVDGVRTSYADVVEKTSPAVVRIESQVKTNVSAPQAPNGEEDFFKNFPMMPQQQQRPRVERGLGSGVIVNNEGIILTNAHVIDGADKITVILSNNKTYEAKLIGEDKPSDLAVIKIEGENFPFLTLGNSDNVRIGDIVLAIGNPLGVGQTVTQGIISAKGRRTGLSDGSLGSFQDFLQTDAAINRGNSGGALVNVSGELIGINSQILSPSGGSIGIGFSIPSNMAKSVMDQLVQNGKVRRGMLGVGIQDLTEKTAKALQLKETSGVLVNDVKEGSSAEKAGIKRGDIIISINGEKVEDGNVLRNKVAGTLPGSSIKIVVMREGKQEEFTATLDEFDLAKAPTTNGEQSEKEVPSIENQSGKLGLSLRPLTPQIAKQLGLPESSSGLVVEEVDPNGAAAEEGISRGDVILTINQQPVKTLDEVKAILDKASDQPILLLISSKGRTVFLTVTPR